MLHFDSSHVVTKILTHNELEIFLHHFLGQRLFHAELALNLEQFWVILEALEAIFASLRSVEAPLGHLGTPGPSCNPLGNVLEPS